MFTKSPAPHFQGLVASLEPQLRAAFQDEDPLVLFLVIPETLRRSVAAGNDALDADVRALGQDFDEFLGEVGRQVGEEVVHSSVLYPSNVPFRRPSQSRFRIRRARLAPPRAMDALERERLDGSDAPANLRGREWDQIRVAVHEAHPAAVLHDLQNVAAQDRALAVCAIGRVQHGAALEVPATAAEGSTSGEFTINYRLLLVQV
jgi:hypothetical protein